MVSPKLFKQMAPDWALPVEFKVIEPVRGFNERWSLARRRVSDTNAIGGGTETNFLLNWYGGASMATLI